MMSLSARRAWIEILILARQVCLIWSLSARRAWIEMRVLDGSKSSIEVALRKESVDRNQNTKPTKQTQNRRSPQGERG